MSEVQPGEVASGIHDTYHPPALSSDHVDNDTTGSPVSRPWQLITWCRLGQLPPGLSRLDIRSTNTCSRPGPRTAHKQRRAAFLVSTLEKPPTSPFPSSQTADRASPAPKSGASSVTPGTAKKEPPELSHTALSQTSSNIFTPNPVVQRIIPLLGGTSPDPPRLAPNQQPNPPSGLLPANATSSAAHAALNVAGRSLALKQRIASEKREHTSAAVRTETSMIPPPPLPYHITPAAPHRTAPNR